MKKIIFFLVFSIIININVYAYCDELAQENSNIAAADILPNIFSSKTERELKSHIIFLKCRHFGQHSLLKIIPILKIQL